ncbi:MAG: hypothetical protein GEV06_10985 [Luteitalea sp.]|nr:hypothetical protein [Luteitalea sp.]
MDIHFVSSANPDDEDRFAPMLLQALRPLLDRLPIAYTLQIRTATGQVLQHSRADVPAARQEAAPQEEAVADGFSLPLASRPSFD